MMRDINPRHAIAIAIGIAILIALPMVVKSSFAIDIFVRILLFAFIGTAWNLMGGYAKQLSLGHAAYFGLGAPGEIAEFQEDQHQGLRGGDGGDGEVGAAQAEA